MTHVLACPKCDFVDRWADIELVSGSGTDTHTYIQLHCQCSNEPVMQFVVDLTPDFEREDITEEAI
jgi:hypothetical protein